MFGPQIKPKLVDCVNTHIQAAKLENVHWSHFEQSCHNFSLANFPVRSKKKINTQYLTKLDKFNLNINTESPMGAGMA